MIITSKRDLNVEEINQEKTLFAEFEKHVINIGKERSTLTFSNNSGNWD